MVVQAFLVFGILGIHGVEPLVEGEHTLDVSLTDTATRAHMSHIQGLGILSLQTVTELLEGKVSHHLLTGHYQVRQTGYLNTQTHIYT